MEAVNDWLRGCVRISCAPADFADETLGNAMRITRMLACDYLNGQAGVGASGESAEIVNVVVSDSGDLQQVFEDYSIAAGQSYAYLVEQYSNGQAIKTHVLTVKTGLSGFFIGNLDEQYTCDINAECTSQLNFATSFVQTYYATYPHVISNGNQQYHTGTFSGVFMELGEDCRFNLETADEYRRKVKAFLATPQPKVLRTPYGDNWYIQVNGVVREEAFGYGGLRALSFDWTEVGEPPAVGIVVKANE